MGAEGSQVGLGLSLSILPGVQGIDSNDFLGERENVRISSGECEDMITHLSDKVSHAAE